MLNVNLTPGLQCVSYSILILPLIFFFFLTVMYLCAVKSLVVMQVL